jgi:hypothetical protein
MVDDSRPSEVLGQSSIAGEAAASAMYKTSAMDVMRLRAFSNIGVRLRATC